jgi:REP-associated tyrosine transposase
VPRQARQEEAGRYYHVTARGNSGNRIFLDDDDYGFLFAYTAHAVARFDWRCFAYCFLPNHYHLVVRIGTPLLSRGMQWLNGRYARTHNVRHKRTGHLFGDRYRTALIESDGHLVEACRYVDLNPVRARLCTHPREWPWSSYRASAGEVAQPSLLSLEVVTRFGGPTAYGDYVAEAIPMRVRP